MREWTPLSVKSNPEPVVRSFTVRLARTSPAPAKAGNPCGDVDGDATDVIVTELYLSRVKPSSIGSPIPLGLSTKPRGNRAARAGPSNVASTPSPVVLTTRPEYFSAIRCAIRS